MESMTETNVDDGRWAQAGPGPGSHVASASAGELKWRCLMVGSEHWALIFRKSASGRFLNLCFCFSVFRPASKEGKACEVISSV